MRLILILSFVFFSVECFAKHNLATLPLLTHVSKIGISSKPKPVSAADFLKMTVKDVEKLSGRKLKLKEKIAFKLLQLKAKKEIKNKEKITYSKRSKTAFVLSILSLVTLIVIPVSVTLSVISIILASKSLKENNEDKKARTAMGLSILALGLILVAFLIYGVFVSDGAFKLVTFS